MGSAHEYRQGKRPCGHEDHQEVTEMQFRRFLSLSFLLVGLIHIVLRWARA